MAVLITPAGEEQEVEHEHPLTIEAIGRLLGSETVVPLRINNGYFLFYDEDAKMIKDHQINQRATDLAYLHGRLRRYDTLAGPVVLADRKEFRL